MKIIYKILIVLLGITTVAQAQTNNPIVEFLVENPYPNPAIIEEDANGEIYFATLSDGIRKLNQNQDPLTSTRILGTTIPRNNEIAIEGTTLFYTDDGANNLTQRINKVDLNNLSQAPVLLYEKTFAQNENRRFFSGLETSGTDLFFWDNNKLFKINTSQTLPTPQLVFAESDSNASGGASNIVGNFLYYIFSDGIPLEGNNKIKRINLTNFTSEVIFESTSINPSGRALGIKNDKVYFSDNGQNIVIVDLNNLSATPKVFLSDISGIIVNGIINNDLYASTVFITPSEKVIKVNVSSAEASITTRPNQDTVEGSTNFSYGVNIEADIPQFIIAGQGFDVDFGEIKMQIHEVNSSDVNNPEDVFGQVLIRESMTKEFANGTSNFTFNLLSPNVSTADLSSGKKYRLRLFNTGLGEVYSNSLSFELVVNTPPVLSIGDVEQLPKNIALYPNPTSDVINISYPVDKVSLFDVLGRLVIESKENQISLKGMPDGLYIVKVETNNTIQNYKVIKK